MAVSLLPPETTVADEGQDVRVCVEITTGSLERDLTLKVEHNGECWQGKALQC